MLRQTGRDPLTWSFAKLFARHVTQQLRTFEGVPGSHAWRWRSRGGLWRARLLTKAQVVGVLVSVHERADRVELLVDDGTALVKAVRWSTSGWDRRVALGDLVLVQGKLALDKTPGSGGEREIRVVHVARVDDPNEELLHWVHVMELARNVYSVNADGSSNSSSSVDALASVPRSRASQWDRIAAQAFFELVVDAQAKMHFLERTNAEAHDALLVETLEALVREQAMQQQQQQQQQQQLSPLGGDALAVRVTFIDTLSRISQEGKYSRDEAQVVRRLRKAFATLRSSGLLFLEDTDTDRHVLLSFEFALQPALLQHLQDVGSDGQSVAELTEWTVTQRKFRRLPLQWFELSLQRLLRSGLVTQREDSQRFHVTDA